MWAFALTCVVATSAAAQGPFAGLFGGRNKDQLQTLDLRAALFGGYDDSVLSLLPGAAPDDRFVLDDGSRFQNHGFASGFNAALAYRLSKRWAGSQFQFSGDAAFTEFGAGLESGVFWASTYSARAQVIKDLTTRTTVAAGGGATYAPFYQYAPFLKDGNEASSVSSGYGLAVNSTWVGAFDASASMTTRPSAKTSLSANVGWREAQDGNLQQSPVVNLDPEASPPPLGNALPAITGDWVETLDASALMTHNFSSKTSFLGDVGWHNARQVTGDQPGSVETRSIHAGLSHNLTRKLSVHGGYGISQGRYSLVDDAPWSFYHTLDLGVGYGDGLTLSFAERYKLSLSIGMSLVRNGDPAAVLTSGEGQQTVFRVDGGATLTRLIGRTWSASVGYVRATSYIVGFRQPLFTDSATTSIGGQVAPRLQFSAGATYTRGQLAFSAGDDVITSYNASTRLTYGMSRYVGLYGQASYYNYDSAATASAIRLPPTLRRRSASVGLSCWLPIIGAGPRS